MPVPWAPCSTGAVRLADFWRLMDEEFGRPRARLLADHHVFPELGGRSAQEALDLGREPKVVWDAVCEAMDVPPERRLGKDRPLRRH